MACLAFVAVFKSQKLLIKNQQTTKETYMKILILTLAIFVSTQSFANYYEEVAILKNNIVTTAQKYQGKGDPDYKIQKELEPMVEKLISLSPQPKVSDRLPLLFGVWKQVWGPYEYKDNKRGVDPSLKADEIYQVVSPEGYYYNVNPNLDPKTNKEQRVDFLRGEYKLSKTNPNGLDVKFTKFIGTKTRPSDKPIYSYVDEAERDQLPNQVTVVPRTIVRLFFAGGTLQEVYTDGNLRILYGTNSKEFKNKYLYIMTKVK